MNADKDTLLGEWNLSDDAQIPWRTDGLCTSGPLVTYLENGPTAPAITMLGATDGSVVATTLAAYGVSSKILGAPNPAGFDPYFDFRFQVWDQIPSEECDSCWQISGWGDYAPSWAPYATQWTNKQDASALLPCAFNVYSNLLNSLLCCNDAVRPISAVASSARNTPKSFYSPSRRTTSPGLAAQRMPRPLNR